MSRVKYVVVFLVMLFVAGSLAAQNGTWSWARSSGGSSDDTAVGIARDSQDYLYICGWFTGQANFGATTLTATGSMDMYVAKLSSDGAWLWVKQAGGTQSCEPTGIAVDANNEVYVCGNLNGSSNFGMYTLSTLGATDVFVTKLSTDGDWLWALRGGGNDMDAVRDLDVAPDGSIYLGGSFWRTATFGNSTFTSQSTSSDIFVARVDPTGSWLWAKQAGGNYYDDCLGITQSGADVYVTGYFWNTAAFGDFSLTSVGNKDIYVARLDASTGGWMNAWQAGSSDANVGTSVRTDGGGNVYLSGAGGGTLNFGAISVFAPGSYVAKLSPQGEWLWAIQVPGGDAEKKALCFDQNANLVMAGSFSGVPYFGDVMLIPHAGKDIFVAGLSPSGNWLWAKAAGGNGDDIARGVVCGSGGNTYISGTFASSCEFDALSLTSAGLHDAFAARLSGSSPVDDDLAPVISIVQLGQNYPNPFQSSVEIGLKATRKVACELSIYNLRGQKVKNLMNSHIEQGDYSYTWDGRDELGTQVASGIYFLRLQTEGQKPLSRKLIKLQ